MTTVPESTDYADAARLAIYLEIGWSDFIFGKSTDARSRNEQYPNPLLDRVPPVFPIQIATLTRSWADKAGIEVKNYCDIGGATGRVVFEVERLFPNLDHIALVEPSKLFCSWSNNLLNSDDELPTVPVVSSSGCQKYIMAASRPPAIRNAKERLTIVNDTFENFRPQCGFDLVTCLNVVDRHSSPSALIGKISSLLNPNGLLVLSCPFDFKEETTPDQDAWIEDLNSLFVGKEPWVHVASDELFYEYRAFDRHWTRFCTQVVGKRWIGAPWQKPM